MINGMHLSTYVRLWLCLSSLPLHPFSALLLRLTSELSLNGIGEMLRIGADALPPPPLPLPLPPPLRLARADGVLDDDVREALDPPPFSVFDPDGPEGRPRFSLPVVILPPRNFLIFGRQRGL